jgi:hypothetical protein
MFAKKALTNLEQMELGKVLDAGAVKVGELLKTPREDRGFILEAAKAVDAHQARGETKRHNLVTESIGERQLDLQRAQGSPKEIVFSKGAPRDGFTVGMIYYVDQDGKLLSSKKGGEPVKDYEVRKLK